MAEIEVLVAPKKSLKIEEALGGAVSALPPLEGQQVGQQVLPQPSEARTVVQDGAASVVPSQYKLRRDQSRKNAASATAKLHKRVMKPLTEKCVPDKDHILRGPQKRINLFPGKHGKAHKDDFVPHKTSNIVFRMPKVRDPELILRKRTEKMVQKLIKYMKKSWKIKIDPKQAERELVYRTINTVSTVKPDNWRELIEQREEMATHTGFFCGFDGPYDSLIELELDTPMLVFKNLPPDLRITATRWLRYKALKEELKRKRDAYLPRIPRNKIKRPSFARGRLIKDPGGIKGVDHFVQVAERFQKLTRGAVCYSKVLSDYTQKKEDENESLNSGFGTIRGNLKFGFKAGQQSAEEERAHKTSEEGKIRQGKSDRRDSLTDGRKYQREMLNMEFMIAALYDIIKSILNIKLKQLHAKLPLPTQVMLQLRHTSPETKHPVKKAPTPKALKKRAEKNPAIYTNAFPTPTGSNEHSSEEDNEEEENCISEPDLSTMEKNLTLKFQAKIAAPPDPNLRSRFDKPSTLKAKDVINLSPVRSSTRLIEDIKKVHSINEARSNKKKGKGMSPQQKIALLVEQPEHAAIRLARNADTYSKLFDRHKKAKLPIWQNVQIDHFAAVAPTGKKPTINGTTEASTLSEADPEEIVEAALRKRQTLHQPGTTKRWPTEEEISTPTFPFGASLVKISSEEQSRRNLLAKAANLDAIPGTPVRRLYKLAGVRTTDKQTFNTLLDMKGSFRATEKRVRVYYANEIGKMEYDTVNRFRSKLNAMEPGPVYQNTLMLMRAAMKLAQKDDEEDTLQRLGGNEEGGVKRTALWFRKLLEDCSEIGAVRHSGCQEALQKLLKYSDIDLKSKSQMLSRLALLVVSLPTTELGARHWQKAILFLLENLFGAPPDVLYQWLGYRNLPYLV